MYTPFRHLRFTLRQLRKAPSFALTTTLTLALAIGVATTMCIGSGNLPFQTAPLTAFAGMA